jgi:sigma-E factor negative regulatory protein RseB
VSFRFLRRLTFGLLCVSGIHVAPVYAASLIEQTPSQTHDVLTRVQQAAQTLNYQGLFAFHENSAMHSMRIIHRYDGQNQQERLIELDDAPREYLRFNDVVQCFMPDQKTILIEPVTGKRFPDLAVGEMHAVLKNYTLWLDPKPHRVAGRACQRYEIQPRDNFRRAHTMCVDTESGLLLKSQAINTLGQVIEQVAFSEIIIGGQISDQAFEPSWSTEGWRVIEYAQKPVDLQALGWKILPAAGFEQQMQMNRMLTPSDWVHQVVLSDGLAVMSIFIEPYNPQQSDVTLAETGQIGSVNMQSIQIKDYLVTVLGEVPPETILQIVNSIEFQTPQVQPESKR